MAISEAMYREEAEALAMIKAMEEELDPVSSALVARFEREVAEYEATHHIVYPSSQQSAPA